jgi:MFS transporter, PHS family, inorganic phosphate transporter
MTATARRAPYPDLDAGISRAALAQLDEAAICAEHWTILITAGMGFFTDAYDLFIIGVAATIISSQWHIAGHQNSLLSSLALLTSAAGAIFFGRLADKLGRRKVYGYEVLVQGISLEAIAEAAYAGSVVTVPMPESRQAQPPAA